MNRYITNDLSDDYEEAKPCYYEMKKMKDLRIGDYIKMKMGYLRLYEFRGLTSGPEVFMRIQSRWDNQDNQDKQICEVLYEPEELVKRVHPKYRMGDTVRIMCDPKRGKLGSPNIQIAMIDMDDDDGDYMYWGTKYEYLHSRADLVLVCSRRETMNEAF